VGVSSGKYKDGAFVRIDLHRPGWNRPELHADPIDRIGTETTEALPLLSVAETTNVDPEVQEANGCENDGGSLLMWYLRDCIEGD
jgi:hypothetical protein